jgi:hypothetical protein
MKRFLLLLLSLALLLSLGSCAPPKPALKDSFDIPVQIAGTLDCAAELHREPDRITLTLASPPSLAGLSYTCSPDETTASYNGLRCITGGGTLPDTALPQLLYTVLTEMENAAFLRSEEDGDVYQLYGATVTISGGVPVQIDVTDPPYSITAEE